MLKRLLYFLLLLLMAFVIHSCSVTDNTALNKSTRTDIMSFSLLDGNSGEKFNAFLISNDTIHIQVPNHMDLTNAIAEFEWEGEGIFVNREEQLSGITKNDFSDFCRPLQYVVNGWGNKKNFFVKIYNLPIVYVNTPDSVDITSRYNWQEGCSFSIRETDGTVEDYGSANIRGRGNWTWREGLKNGKKPLAVKLVNKPKDRTVLGMPGHKRWILLSNPLDYLPNPVGFEVNRRAETCKWSPHSRYVELMLNGKHKGLYLLCEQIRIDKNRVNIKELKKSDLEGDAVTGGYLISYDTADEDFDPKFYSQYYRMPVMVKNPDSDDIQKEQLAYIRNYINAAEWSLYDDDKYANKEYYNFFDIDSWIDYYFVEELWGAYELKSPRSGKLTAGPAWDMEQNYFNDQTLYCDSALYYCRLFKDKHVLNRMKEKWPQFRSNLLGNSKYKSILLHVDSLYEVSHLSARRDRWMTPSSYNYHLPDTASTIDLEYQVIRDGFMKKVDWLEEQIMSW